MSKQDPLTLLAKQALSDPNYSPTGEPQPIEDKDFTDATNDVSSVGRITLGVFLSNKTKDAKNEYSVSSKSALTKVNARGQVLEKAEINDQKVFADQRLSDLTLRSSGLGVKNASQLVGENRQITFFDQSQIDEILSKTASDTNKLGHTLLSEVPESTTNPVSKKQPSSPRPTGDSRGIKLIQKVHDQLKDGNMYSPDPAAGDNPFISDPFGQNEEQVTRGLFSIQRNLGSFDKDGQRVQVSDMSAIAMALLLRSVGNMKGAEQVLQNKSLGIAGPTALLVFLRGEQLGFVGNGIDVYRLKYIKSAATNATGPTARAAASATGQDDFYISMIADGNLLTRGSPPNNDPELPNLQSWPLNKNSYAQMNSFLEPFGSKFSSLGMFVFATLSVGLLYAIAFVIGLKAKQTNDPRVPSNKPYLMSFGSRKSAPLSKKDEILYKILEIADTDNDFGDSLSIGIPAMFGIDEDTVKNPAKLKDANTMLDIATNLVLSAGYYANFTRRLLAETVTIGNTFAKIATANPVQGIENFFKAIESLISSPLYKFLMISAGVGDISLKREQDPAFLTENQMYLPNNTPIPTSDFVKAQISLDRRRLNRWNDGTNALSLKTFRAAQRQLPTALSGSLQGPRFISPGKADDIKKLEEGLEAEYMPFYIHDLRTQEIMSFPAFITEFGETFTPSYNAVEGIGRQDPVRLYQKTERAVTFGFMLVSYNPEDHDHMWLAINKLVAMCYPQYSAGRIRELEQGQGNDRKLTKFIQPFSQVQAASPMIRLRLADVFKSNYSKFGLARLFGARSTVLAASIDEKQKTVKDAQKKYDDALGKAKQKVKDDFALAKSKPDTNLSGYEIVLNQDTPLYVEGVGKAQLTVSANSTAKIVGVKKLNQPEKGTQGKKGYQPASTFYGVTVKDVFDQGLQQDVATFLSSQNASAAFKTAAGKTEFLIFSKGFEDAEMSDKYFRSKYEGDSSVQTAANDLKKLTQDMPTADFFNAGSSPNGNAIVRSFESTRGRGVAGFITSLALDYGMGNHPWDDRPGSRAPMIVKISMGFAPITDLPLGLDYNGDIRNPSHPVGQYAGSFGDVYSDINTSNGFSNTTPPTLDKVIETTKTENSTAEAIKLQATRRLS